MDGSGNNERLNAGAKNQTLPKRGGKAKAKDSE